MILQADYTGVFLLATFIGHLPAIIMFIIGAAIRKRNEKASTVLFIIAGIYTIIGLGFCGSIFFGGL